MRVSRRIRPSQVGCAASASRRRLQAASLIESSDATQPRTLPRPSLVIQPDGQILQAKNVMPNSLGHAAYDDSDSIAVASARG